MPILGLCFSTDFMWISQEYTPYMITFIKKITFIAGAHIKIKEAVS